MATVEKTIQIDRDVSTVYNQWTQFEDFPKFMQGVERVTQKDDTHLHWKADIGFVEREWDAEIVKQTPDEIIAWRSIGEVRNDGQVTFTESPGGGTQVSLRLDYDTSGFAEKLGDVANVVDKRVEGDLERFKAFIEERGTETGAYRERH